MPDHDKEQDIITDNDPKECIIPEVMTEDIIIDANGISRNSMGQVVKGSKSLYPKGAPKKIKSLNKLIERKCGEDAERLVQKLVMIALYDPEQPEIVYDKKTGDVKTKKKLFHFYNATTQLQALTLLMKYYFGSPAEKIQVDKTVDIRIHKQIADLTKIINANHEKLQIVKGGKE